MGDERKLRSKAHTEDYPLLFEAPHQFVITNQQEDYTMTKLYACDWCFKPVTVENDFDERTAKALCCWSCYQAEKLFCKYYSDDCITMRSYYQGKEWE